MCDNIDLIVVRDTDIFTLELWLTEYSGLPEIYEQPTALHDNLWVIYGLQVKLWVTIYIYIYIYIYILFA